MQLISPDDPSFADPEKYLTRYTVFCCLKLSPETVCENAAILLGIAENSTDSTVSTLVTRPVNNASKGYMPEQDEFCKVTVGAVEIRAAAGKQEPTLLKVSLGGFYALLLSCTLQTNTVANFTRSSKACFSHKLGRT